MKFIPAAENPPVARGNMREYIVLLRDSLRAWCCSLWYINEYDFDDRTLTGWYVLESEDDSAYFYPIKAEVVAWSDFPTAEEARSMMDGPW